MNFKPLHLGAGEKRAGVMIFEHLELATLGSRGSGMQILGLALGEKLWNLRIQHAGFSACLGKPCFLQLLPCCVNYW